MKKFNINALQRYSCAEIIQSSITHTMKNGQSGVEYFSLRVLNLIFKNFIASNKLRDDKNYHLKISYNS